MAAENVISSQVRDNETRFYGKYCWMLSFSLFFFFSLTLLASSGHIDFTANQINFFLMYIERCCFPSQNQKLLMILLNTSEAKKIKKSHAVFSVPLCDLSHSTSR